MPQTTSSLSDASLVQAITKEGKSDLYGVLYDRYSDKVFRKCISFAKDEDIAQDMVQDIFLKVFFQLAKFKGNSKFSTWLYAITYNFCVEYYRKKKKHQFVDIEHESDKADEEKEEQELMAAKAELLDVAMGRLDPEDRVLLLMKYQDETPIKDIMENLKISESAVKMRLSRARQRAKKLIKEIEERDYL